MTLNEYMATRRRPLTQAEVAFALSCHKSTVCRILSGRGCSRRIAHRIEEWTSGVVTASDVLLAQRLERRGDPDAAVRPAA